MQLSMVVLYKLILLITTFSTGSESTGHSVTVKLNENATLSCSERCSGLVRWTVFSKPKDTLAECDQTSCRSVKEGYQMIHHQYLNGDLSLTITDADFSKRARYTCDCDGKDLCDVQLLIESLNTTVQIQTGESLVLDLHIPEDVEVLYNSAGASSGQICTVAVHSQCTPEHTQRVSAAVTLRGVTPSDSGVYTIKDKLNEEVIHTYTVSVQDVQDSWVWKSGYESGYKKGSSDGYQKGSSDGYQKGMGAGALLVVFVALLLLIVVFVVGVLAAPRVRPLMNRCVNMLRYKDSSHRDQMQDEENGRPLRSDSASLSSE